MNNSNLLIEQSIQAADSLCSQSNARFTDMRKTVFRLILEHNAPIKAYELLERLKIYKSSVQPPTVYRAINFLMELGLVHKLSSLNAYFACSHPHKRHNCFFLLCKECGLIQESCNSPLLESLRATAKKNKFLAEFFSVEIKGLCSNCS